MTAKYSGIVNMVMDDFKQTINKIIIDKNANNSIKFHTETQLDNNKKMVVCKVELIDNEEPEQKEEKPKDLRICKKCGMSEAVNKFRDIGRTCIKCYSKTNNEKMKNKEYYKNYYLEHEGKNHKRQGKKGNQDPPQSPPAVASA